METKEYIITKDKIYKRIKHKKLYVNNYVFIPLPSVISALLIYKKTLLPFKYDRIDTYITFLKSQPDTLYTLKYQLSHNNNNIVYYINTERTGPIELPENSFDKIYRIINIERRLINNYRGW